MVHTPRVRRDGGVGHQLRGGRRSAVASEEPQVPRPGPSVVTARTSSVRRDCGGDGEHYRRGRGVDRSWCCEMGGKCLVALRK